MLSNNKVQLGGKCTIQIDTGKGSAKMEIPKKNPRTGENNADEFIKQALHFAIMRHGTDGVIKVIQDQQI